MYDFNSAKNIWLGGSMDSVLSDFINYLSSEKKMAQNSLEAYKRDVLEFSELIRGKHGLSLNEASNTEVVAYLLKLKNDGKSAATVNRKVASLMAFYNYLKGAAKMGVPGAKTIYEDLSTRFPGRTVKKEA